MVLRFTIVCLVQEDVCVCKREGEREGVELVFLGGPRTNNTTPGIVNWLIIDIKHCFKKKNKFARVLSPIF